MGYRIPSHLSGFGGPEHFQPYGLTLAPLAGHPMRGMGADPSTPDPNANKNVVQMSDGAKIAVAGLGALLLAGLGWLVYKEVQLKQQIVEKGGGDALMKYELGRAAGTLAYGLTGGYKRNKKKRRRNKSSKKRNKKAFLTNSDSEPVAPKRRIVHGAAARMPPPLRPLTKEEEANRRSERLSERRAEEMMERWIYRNNRKKH